MDVSVDKETEPIFHAGSHMHKIACLLAVLLLVCQTVAGQASTSGQTAVTLQNQENSTFYYVLDPAELAGITASSPLLESEVALYFSQETEAFPFSTMKPKTTVTIEGLAAGTHLLVGFFAMEEKTEFPVRIISVQVDTKLGQRTYELYSEPALLNPARGLGKLARFGATPSPLAAAEAKTPAVTAVEAAAQAVEKPPTVELSEIATFSNTYTPAVFTREKEKSFIVLPIEQAGYWNRNGTRIASLSGRMTAKTMNLEIISASGFSKNVSYFIYLFENRNLGQENTYTIEIIPVLEGRSGGAALLWVKGRAAPSYFGTMTVEGPVLRIAADLALLPSGLRDSIGSGASADVTSCYFDDGVKTYEEFFYTTFAISELAAAIH